MKNFSHAPSLHNANAFLISNLISHGVVTSSSPAAIALQRVNRSWFLPRDAQQLALNDAPIAIPGGQTNSQPMTVAIMLRELDAHPGDHVLDVGFGSGWTTALLAVMVEASGYVWGVEMNIETYAFGRENIAYFSQESGIRNIILAQGDGKDGLVIAAPFNGILVSAGAEAVPNALLDQLARGGRMVIPVRDGNTESLHIIDKDHSDSMHRRIIPGFRFVPLL